MKNILYTAACLLVLLCIGSCRKLTTEGVTGITYYATLTVKGDSKILHQKGDAYTDPGCSAVLKGEDVTAQIKTESTVNINKSGVYSVSYSVTNVDGFTSSASRTVIVYDKTDAVEGVYAVNPASYSLKDGEKTVYGGDFEIIVTKTDDGKIVFDDLLGGYYCQRANYGSKYAMEATVTLAADGAMTLESSLVPGWEDSASSLTGKYIRAEKKFDYCAVYAEMDFNVILTKK